MRRRDDAVSSGVPRALLLAADLAVGAASHGTRLALQIGATGWDAGVSVGRLVSALPGADGPGRLLNTATRPLIDDGRRARTRARSLARTSTERLLETFVPSIVDALDPDALVQRIDIDRLVRRIDIDPLVQRIDIDTLVRRIEIDALVRRIDIDTLVRRIDIDTLVQRIDIDTLVRRIEIDALVQRVDIGAIVDRIDVNEVVQRVDVDAVVEETELGTIVARSTSGFASEALDAARSQTAGVDTLVSRAVNRVLRRKEGDVPVGPPLLSGETVVEDTASTSGVEPPPPQAPDAPRGGSG